MKNPSSRRRALVAFLAVAVAALGLSATAQAKLTGEYTKFTNCEYENTEVKKCILSITESGEVKLGNKKVPITKAVTLQGGYGAVGEDEFSQFFGATNGVTLSKTPQNVPGGLAGLVNCKEISNWLLRISCEVTFENGLTGVNATLELAKPASEIRISENNLAGEEGTALELPVKVHLENPFLGSKCFVGSSSSPITWNLTTGETSPPSPNEPITGAPGEAEFLEGGRILSLKGNELVDNAWSAPSPTGCGGIISFLVTPIIKAQLGTTTAGHNTAILTGTVNVASGAAVRKNDAENP